MSVPMIDSKTHSNSVEFWYAVYCGWCARNGEKVVDFETFTKQVCDEMDLKALTDAEGKLRFTSSYGRPKNSADAVRKTNVSGTYGRS